MEIAQIIAVALSVIERGSDWIKRAIEIQGIEKSTGETGDTVEKKKALWKEIQAQMDAMP